MVLRASFPQMQVVPYLMLPDKNERTAIEGLNSQFEITKLPQSEGSRFRGFQVDFTGDLNALRKETLLTKAPMEELVTPLLPILANAARLET